MQLLSRSAIQDSLSVADPDSLWIDPLLDQGQIGEASVDLRLGYDFLVSVLTRRPYISISPVEESHRGVETYFQYTRRDVGDKFVLYPGQVALSTTLEYVSLPPTVGADLLTRSSYNRLGIHLNTMLQPGFRGCPSLELFNHGNNPVEIVVGSRVVQARFVDVGESRPYGGGARKYFGDVRPTLSRIGTDADFAVLDRMKQLSSV